MMLQQTLLVIKLNFSKINLRLYTFGYIAFFFFFLTTRVAFSQTINNRKTDTIWLARYENVVLKTTNGSECVCSIQNPSSSQSATISASGAAPDIVFNDSIPFNGIHILRVNQQIIALANFEGKELLIGNFSLEEIKVIVSILCMKDD